MWSLLPNVVWAEPYAYLCDIIFRIKSLLFLSLSYFLNNMYIRLLKLYLYFSSISYLVNILNFMFVHFILINIKFLSIFNLFNITFVIGQLVNYYFIIVIIYKYVYFISLDISSTIALWLRKGPDRISEYHLNLMHAMSKLNFWSYFFIKMMF